MLAPECIRNSSQGRKTHPRLAQSAGRACCWQPSRRTPLTLGWKGTHSCVSNAIRPEPMSCRPNRPPRRPDLTLHTAPLVLVVFHKVVQSILNKFQYIPPYGRAIGSDAAFSPDRLVDAPEPVAGTASAAAHRQRLRSLPRPAVNSGLP